MQHDDWLEPTRDRLRQWAQWLKAERSPVCGAVTVRYQPREIDPVHDALPDEDGTAERMDRILCRVREVDAVVYCVLFEYYYHRDKSERDLAVDLRISRNKVSKLRMQGETMVDVWWRAIESSGVLRDRGADIAIHA